MMIVVTGAGGFIGSCMVSKLNNKGIRNIILVDDFSNPAKEGNLLHKSFREKIHRDHFFEWLDLNHKDLDFIVHLGARTDTAEMDKTVFDRLNLGYTRKMWLACCRYGIPLIYASSAATYGSGEEGYDDDHRLVQRLKPLNPYGESKNDLDKWVLAQKEQPGFWCGLKFFNVFGPNEYHKNRMASVVFHGYNQISRSGKIRLFRSHRPDFEDGKQLRDFIYVKDVVDVIYYLMIRKSGSGIYNLGTGRARSFLDLAHAIFRSLHKSPDIEFIDTPADIRDRYQYFTEAKMDKLRSSGYDYPFYTLEEAVEEYVQGYLVFRGYF